MLAQVVIGTSVGCRFVGYSYREARSVLLAAVLSTVFTVALATVFALALTEALGLRFETLWLAFAPGGLPEMILVSLAMGVDADFVSLHHVSRVVFHRPPPPPRCSTGSRNAR